MGLDMHFSSKRYISEYTDSDKELNTKVKDIAATFVTEWSVREISYRVGYWRKANAIHNWFVKNVQDGEDDCKQYYVGTKSILDLYATVVECLEGGIEVAVNKFPPTAGFFFGSTEIDEYYWQDLEDTKRMLQPIVDAFNEAKELGDKYYTHPIYEYTFHYQSSW